MQTINKKSRGSAAAVIGIILVILAAVAFFLFTRKSDFPRGSGSALEMAKLIPADSQAAWAWDLNGQLDYVGLAQELKELESQLEDEDRQRFQDFEEELGMPLEQWLALFDGRGFFAVSLGQTPEDPGFIGTLGLSNSAEFGAWWKNQAESYSEPVTEHDIDGLKFIAIGPDSLFVGYDDVWLYVADNEENAKKVMTSIKAGNQGLDSNPNFQDGLAQLKIEGAGAFVFADISQLVGQMQAAELPGTDEKTFTELSAFEYGIATVDFVNFGIDAFTKVSGESELAQEILKPGVLSGGTLKSVSGNVTNAHSLDLKWLVNVLIKAAMATPEYRAQASLAGVGLMSQGDPWAAFQGDITVAGDAMRILADTVSDDFTEARGQGQFVACKSNMKNIGTAMEMYSTDWSGRYPSSMDPLTPNYLRTIPTCPAAGRDTYSASLQTGPDAPANEEHRYQDFYQFECQGHFHSETEANYPKYDGLVGLNEGPVVASAPEEPEEESGPKEPSTVVVATLANPESAHAFLNKLIQIGGEPPVEGAEQEYSLPMLIPGVSFKLTNKETPLAIFSYGPNGPSLLDTSSGNLAEKGPVKELLSWSPTGIVYLDYLDLQPAHDALVKNLKKGDSDKAKFGLSLTEMVRGRLNRLDGASCLVVKPTGIHYRSVGVSGASLLGLSGAILVPNFVRARGQGQLTACKSNLKNIGTALEMYATDHAGKYPDNIGVLAPDYLFTIPACPSAGRDTYSESYKLDSPQDEDQWEVFHLHCAGENHIRVGVPPDFPAYNSMLGLIERP